MSSSVFQLVGLAVDAVGIGVSSRNHKKTLEIEEKHREEELHEINKHHAEVIHIIYERLLMVLVTENCLGFIPC